MGCDNSTTTTTTSCPVGATITKCADARYAGVRAALEVLLIELRLAAAVVQVVLRTVIFWIAFRFPTPKRCIVDRLRVRCRMVDTGLDDAAWQDSVVGWAAVRAHCRSLALDARKTVRRGGPAHNSRVYALPVTVRDPTSTAQAAAAADAPSTVFDTAVPHRLLDFERPGRPLVVAFGSGT